MSAEETPPPEMEDIPTAENLNAARAQVKANAGAAGADGRTVARTAEPIKTHRDELLLGLRTGRYRPEAVKAVDIPKANGGTRRPGIPTVLDRLIQQALHRKPSPLREAEFSEHSYGFRPKRSAHDAVRAAQAYVRAGKSRVVDIDLKSFFDHVNHDRLMSHIGRKVRDKRILRLIGDYLRAPMERKDGTQETREKGTPQGGPLSPLLANICLHPLDLELEKRGLSFVRYAGRHRDLLRERTVCGTGGGQRDGMDRTGAKAAGQPGEKRPRPRRWDRVARLPVGDRRDDPPRAEKRGAVQDEGARTVGCEAKRDERAAARTMAKLHPRMVGLLPADRKAPGPARLSGWTRRHMRKCFWLRRHHPRGRLNALKRLGLRGRNLGMAYSGKGAWAMARHRVLQSTLNNRTLERYGFTLPWETATT